MPVSDDDMILKTADFFVSENTLNPKASSEEVAAFIRKYKVTGQVVTTTTNSGGVQGIVVIERKKLDDHESNDVRRALGMDYEIEVDEDEDEEASE